MAIRRRNDELPLLAGRMIDRAGFIKSGHRLSEFALRRRQTFILTQVNSTVVSNYMKFFKILFKNDYLNGRLRYLLEPWRLTQRTLLSLFHRDRSNSPRCYIQG